MFDVQLSEAEVYRESAFVSPGAEAVIEDTPWGRIGHTICYDLRFPHLYRDLARAGAEILTVPAAFTRKTGAAHWHVLNRARAIENGAFVVASAACGPVPGGGETYGHSLIVDPWGVVLADAGDGPGVVQARIDLDEVAAARTRIPSLGHDRDYRRPAPLARAAE
jgi:predicted amidohydrolase